MRRPAWMWPGNSSKSVEALPAIQIGNAVQVQARHDLPLAGNSGTLLDIENDDERPYVVHFGDGLRFRYKRLDLIDLGSSSQAGVGQSGRRTMRILNGIG